MKKWIFFGLLVALAVVVFLVNQHPSMNLPAVSIRLLEPASAPPSLALASRGRSVRLLVFPRTSIRFMSVTSRM
jgi:hypothetical protein